MELSGYGIAESGKSQRCLFARFLLGSANKGDGHLAVKRMLKIALLMVFDI